MVWCFSPLLFVSGGRFLVPFAPFPEEEITDHMAPSDHSSFYSTNGTGIAKTIILGGVECAPTLTLNVDAYF